MYRDDRRAARQFKAEDDPDRRLFAGVGFTRVVEMEGQHPVLAGSPLWPSQPGCMGDRGTLLESGISGAVRHPHGLLHLVDRRADLRPGSRVLVWRDETHRGELERAHAAAVLVQARLAALEINVISVEIAAGLAWIEVARATPSIDLSELTTPAHELSGWPQNESRMSVAVGKQSVVTYLAPISPNSLEVGSGSVRRIAAARRGAESLRIDLEKDTS